MRDLRATDVLEMSTHHPLLESKMTMKKNSCKTALAWLGLAGAILLPLPPAYAQAATANPVPSAPPRAEPRISLEIKQGALRQGATTVPATVANLVENLRDRTADVDFVLSPGVGEMVVSNLTLRSADLRGTLEAICFATGNKVRVSPLGKDNVYALSLGLTARPDTSLAAFNLSALLDPLGPRESKAVAMQVEEITQLILTTVLSFDERTKQERGKPLLSFHPGTALLVVIAHPGQLEMVSQIVEALNAPVRSTAAARQEPAPTTPKRERTSPPRSATP